MKTVTSGFPTQSDFSLVLGGPLYQFYLRCRLMRPPLELWHRRIAIGALVTWVPLLALSAVGGHAAGGVGVPFLQDVSTHARFLVALPLLIVAEVVVHLRVGEIVSQFRERALIAPSDETEFDGAIATARAWRNSVTAELILLVAAFGLHWVWVQHTALHVPTWYAVGGGGRRYTPAGYWYAFVSLPIFRFMLIRWYFRLAIWYRFLWRVSRLSLRVNPLHPDRSGGLGFLGASTQALQPILVAHTVLLAGVLGDRIWHEGARLPQFGREIGVVVGALMLLVLTPLMFFGPALARARRQGLRSYGELASRYVDDFVGKWIEPTRVTEPADPQLLLGSGDIQSLADLANSFEVVRTMRVLPFDKQVGIATAVAMLLPLVPLLLTMVPLNQLLQQALKLVL